eukprot:412020-Pelagomonas_calceolata.AAC.1
MGCVWNSRSALGSWLPLCLLPPACGIWVASRDKACVRGVGRTWVGFVPCSSVGDPSIRELSFMGTSLLVSCASVCVWLSGGGLSWL